MKENLQTSAAACSVASVGGRMTQAPQKTQQQRGEELATNVSPNKPMNSEAEGKQQTDFPEPDHHLKTPTQPV